MHTGAAPVCKPHYITGRLSHLEELSDHARALAHILLHQLAADDADEAGVRPVGHSARQQRLPSACTQREASSVMAACCAGSLCMGCAGQAPAAHRPISQAGRLAAQHHAMTSIRPEGHKLLCAPLPVCTHHGTAQANALSKRSV